MRIWIKGTLSIVNICILAFRLVATTRARLAEQGDTRPFTHSHFFRYGEKVEGQEKDLLAIVQTQARPPHYVVQVHNF